MQQDLTKADFVTTAQNAAIIGKQHFQTKKTKRYNCLGYKGG
jgi:hypothetical protein